MPSGAVVSGLGGAKGTGGGAGKADLGGLATTTRSVTSGARTLGRAGSLRPRSRRACSRALTTLSFTSRLLSSPQQQRDELLVAVGQEIRGDRQHEQADAC